MDSWNALAEELEAAVRRPGLLRTTHHSEQEYLSTRCFINEGMRAGIPNPKTRERTITLYLDKADFRAALDMKDEEHIYILVVDRQGNEFFRTRGPYSREGESALRQALLQLTPQAGE